MRQFQTAFDGAFMVANGIQFPRLDDQFGQVFHPDTVYVKFGYVLFSEEEYYVEWSQYEEQRVNVINFPESEPLEFPNPLPVTVHQDVTNPEPVKVVMDSSDTGIGGEGAELTINYFQKR